MTKKGEALMLSSARRVISVAACTLACLSAGSAIAVASQLQPVVKNVLPLAGQELGGTQVTITGEHFENASAVTFGSVPAKGTPIVNSPTSITAVAPELLDGTGTGYFDVTVTTPGGTSATSSADKFLSRPSPVFGWGGNGGGQLGNGTLAKTLEPGPISELSEPTAIGAGNDQVLAVVELGKVVSWGEDNEGELGNGQTSGTPQDTPGAVCAPVELKGCERQLSNISAVASGEAFSLALTTEGNVYAWGSDKYGQLGDEVIGTNSSFPVKVHGLPANEVKAIAAGTAFAVALTNNGKVYAWGQNAAGQLGDNQEGELFNSDTAVEVQGLTEKVTAIAAGGNKAFALREGAVWGWGQGSFGQLGDESSENKRVPVQVSRIGGENEKAIAISAGFDFGMAMMENHRVKTWGSNMLGELGNGTTTFSSHPVLVNKINANEVKAISAGGFFGMALLENEKVETWGDNVDGELGTGEAHGPKTCIGSNGYCSKEPVPAHSLEHATAIFGGEHYAMAIRSIQYTTYDAFSAANEPPARWEPYASTSVWNQPISETESKALAENSQAKVQKISEAGHHEPDPENIDAGEVEVEEPVDFGHPVYWAATTDPFYKLIGNKQKGEEECIHFPSPISGISIRVPVGAQPADGGDGHMAVVEQNGTEYDIYHATVLSNPSGNKPGEIEFWCGSATNINGTGLESEATASEFSLAAGIIRPQELQQGEIHHALFIATYETKEVERPAEHKGHECTQGCTGTPPKMGQRLYFTLSETEINALQIPPWMKTILIALHNYGGYVGDTGGEPGSWGVEVESPMTTLSFKAQYESEHAKELEEHKSEREKLLTGFDDPLKALAEKEYEKPGHNRVVVAEHKHFYEFRMNLEPKEEPVEWEKDLEFIKPPAH
jgi:alpha-tubulin suppressor-like RCC1 family protein